MRHSATEANLIISSGNRHAKCTVSLQKQCSRIEKIENRKNRENVNEKKSDKIKFMFPKKKIY